jgi:glycine/serine hydroxymethyltransferase
MGATEMTAVADLFVRALQNKGASDGAQAIRSKVQALCTRFPAPGPFSSASGVRGSA